MKHVHVYLVLLATLLSLGSCDEAVNDYDPYTDWEARNAQWFEDTVKVAREAIAQAKADYGEAQWQDHCQWRMYKSLLRTTSSVGSLTDSICVRIIKQGADPQGKGSPCYTDSAFVNYRGWIMPVKNYNGNGEEMSLVQEMFDTSYHGDFNPLTAAPTRMSIKNLIEGFSTAIQYMVEGDDWMVFIPYTLAYGTSGSGSIRGYSTLQFRINLHSWYESGSGVPDYWE